MTDMIAQFKLEGRMLMRAKRMSLSRKEAAIAADKVADAVISLKEYQEARVLLAYIAVQGELDVSKIVNDAKNNGKKVAFPLCAENGRLRLLIPNKETAFKKGAYGIPEPDASDSHEINSRELDLIIAPGLAFDMSGNRLGQGGGYYDRLLADTDAYAIGVGYDFQLVEELWVEAHDRKLDCIVTQSQLLRNCG